MVKMFVPSAELSYESDKPLGMAMGVRVEGEMVTAYATADLDTVPYLIDAPIALQAAMVFPVFAKSRESARKAICLSNMKNLALAMQMWLADHDDRFPTTERWVDELMPYLRNEEVLKCPADESGARSSYALNRAVIGKRLTDVEDPSALVVFYETANPGENPVGGPEDVASPARHLGGNSFGYADGHARWVPEAVQESLEVE
jgi:prepilin-type processing-associated H-X9-DG protein